MSRLPATKVAATSIPKSVDADQDALVRCGAGHVLSIRQCGRDDGFWSSRYGTDGPSGEEIIDHGFTLLPPVSVINTATNLVVTTIPVGGAPFEIAVNRQTQRAYVTNFGDSTVSVINTTTNTVIGTIPVGFSPIGVAVNPVTNRVYVANRDSNTVSVITFP